MYDIHALNLINNAPIFGNINFDSLPKEFTHVYTEIIAIRLKINEGQDLDLDELSNKLSKLSKISTTYEAYVILQSEQENMKAAAYIAASAHSLSYQIKNILNPIEISSENIINEHGINSILSASILYFISGYTADSIEIIRKVSINNSESTKNKLFIALNQLLTGNISNLSTNQIVVPSSTNINLIESASEALWIKLHEAVNKILSACTYENQNTNIEFIEAKDIFNLVIELTVSNNEINIESFNIDSQSIFIGQNYLARFLKILADIIPTVSLININAPTGIELGKWKDAISRFTKKRPYLWPNHIEAINTGYLNKGNSSVISFPTGGGKSTLAELKILVSIMLEEPVVFIAPTLALVDQVSNTLKNIFPEANMKINYEMFGTESLEEVALPDISVMTPESCLVKMNFNPELFTNLGLFIFDECHLLNPKSTDSMDRRSIDAMLCLLKIIELSPNSDLLLMSAMLNNSEEIAAWISSIINKNVIPLTLTWKPTQQAKGCVVYKNSDVNDLNSFVRGAPKTNKGLLTASAKRELEILPYGFFSLNQTWHSNQSTDYKLIKLITNTIILGTNKWNQLTTNRNNVAANIAIKSTNNNIKTLIFGLNRKDCESIAHEISNNQTKTIIFTEKEQFLFNLLNIEFGNTSCLYVSNSISSLPHHSLLTKNERLLHEMLFKRKNGIDSLVATSTLAQGINLPAELVIIAGDSRFDQELNRQELLEAHELLNAAGRAGRAGINSKGMVLVIPSKVVSYDSTNRQITNHWLELKEIFASSDQCLSLEDPFQYMIDKIYMSENIDEDSVYFLNNLPSENLTGFINKSFIAYKKSLYGNSEWIQERIEKISSRINQLNAEERTENTFIKNLSSSSGIPISSIQDLYNDLILNINNLTSPIEIVTWYLNWVANSFSRTSYFIRINVLDGQLGNPFESYSNEEKLNFIRVNLVNLINQWVSGETLMQIEANIPFIRNNGKCEKARKFSLKIIPEIAYSIGILCQIYKNYMLEIPIESRPENNLNIELLSQLIKNGMDNPKKLALHYILKDETSRVNTHIIFNNISDYLNENEDSTEFPNLIKQVATAYKQYQLA